MGIIELRINDLKKELQQAEAEVSAASTPVARLNEAQLNFQEARRLVTMNRGQQAEIEQKLGRLEFTLSVTSPMFEKRSGVEAAIRHYRGEVRKLVVACEQLERDALAKEIALNDEQQKIAKHPVYVKARDEQNRLVPEAVRLANLIFETPLKDLRQIFLKIERLVEMENEIILRGQTELRRAGLPEMRCMLSGFFPQVVPRAQISLILDSRCTERWCRILRDMAAQPFRT